MSPIAKVWDFTMTLSTISVWDVTQHVRRALAQIMMTALNARMASYKWPNTLATQNATLKTLT